MKTASRLLLVATTLVVVLVVAAEAARANPGPTVKPIPKALRQGAHGKRVKALQWLLSGHDPSVFRNRKVFVTYTGKIDGRFGSSTALGVRNMKLRLGYKKSQANRVAGIMLFQLLVGKQRRTPAMISRAAFRLRTIAAAQARLKKLQSTCSYREIKWARGQLGVYEIPDGTNRGPGISYPTDRTTPSFQSTTGAYGAAWCVSFVQWVLVKSALGPIANRSAGVFYVKDWAWRLSLLRAIPKPGDLVAFLDNNGHIGLIEAVTPAGIQTIEGNEGNAVRRRFHAWRSTSMVFIAVPGCGT